MRIVEASNVGVKVGMVGRGVMDTVGVAVGTDILVFVGLGDGVDVASRVRGTGETVVVGAQAVSIKITLNRAIKICFNDFLPKSAKKSSLRFSRPNHAAPALGWPRQNGSLMRIAARSALTVRPQAERR